MRAARKEGAMSDLEGTVLLLSGVSMFRGLGRSQLEGLSSRLVSREFATGETIVAQDTGGAGLFIIRSGRAEAVRERADGTKVVVNVFGPASFFGELALLDNGPRTASVVATEPTTCLVLSQWEFLGGLRDDSETAISVLREMTRRFRMALDVL